MGRIGRDNWTSMSYEGHPVPKLNMPVGRESGWLRQTRHRNHTVRAKLSLLDVRQRGLDSGYANQARAGTRDETASKPRY